jgi:hypothetical protein
VKLDVDVRCLHRLLHLLLLLLQCQLLLLQLLELKLQLLGLQRRCLYVKKIEARIEEQVKRLRDIQKAKGCGAEDAAQTLRQPPSSNPYVGLPRAPIPSPYPHLDDGRALLTHLHLQVVVSFATCLTVASGSANARVL